MPEIELKRLRRLRFDAESLLRSLVSDLNAFRHSEPNHGFRRTPTSKSMKDDVGVTTTCSCLMALALADKLDGVYGDKKGRDAATAIFDKILASPWMSSGLPENNAFTTTLVLRLLGFLCEIDPAGKKAHSEKRLWWEPRIQFKDPAAFRRFLESLRTGAQPFSKYLFGLFPKDLQDEIDTFLTPEGELSHGKLQDKISVELERLMGATSFYRDDLFKSEQLSPETLTLLESPNRYNYQIARINRHLLHDAFVGEITAFGSKSLREIADEISSQRDRFKINNYPPTAAVIYWFVDGISRAEMPLSADKWKVLFEFATEEFGRQRSLVVSRHAAMMDPVAMAMSACLCARLWRISTDKPRLGALHSHATMLPSPVELENAAIALFSERADAGIWPKYFPLFHYQDAGSNFCFTFELLEAVLAEFGFEHNRLIADESVIAGLERAITWCKENRLIYTPQDDGDVKDTEPPDRPKRYEGWNSGGNLDTLRKGLPESWATAVVHMFLWELIKVISHHIQSRLVDKYNARMPLPKWNKLDQMLDIPVRFGKEGDGLIEILRGTILKSFEDFRDTSADRLRRAPLFKKPLSALLFGPPGTSKTEVAKALSRELNWPLVEIDPSTFLGRGFQNIYAKGDEIFEDVEDLCGVVVLFDEMDALVQKRESEQSLALESKFLTTYMLPKLAKLHDRGQLIFLMATNFQETFDDAIKRAGRFDLLLCMGPPTLKAKCDFLHKFYGLRDSTEETKTAAARIMNFADQKTWLADQLGLLTFGEFEAFVADIGRPPDIMKLQFDDFLNIVREKTDAVLLKMDDLKQVEFGTTWETLADLDNMQFTRETLSDLAKKLPIIKYLLDRKQSRRQYPIAVNL